MRTSFGENLPMAAIREKVSRFYDLGSPLYLEVYGSHIHDGYYVTGRETKQEAQDNLTSLLVEKARIKRKSKVLDVGCGVGGSSIWMAENLGAATVGISISPVQIEIARKLAKERHVDSSFVLMDAENMQFDDAFDVVWVLAAATHFSDQESFVRKATRFLRPGGKFVIFDWMLDEHVQDALDRYVRPVAERMLLSSLYPLNSYLDWFIDGGYRVTYAEDVTDHTIQTWNQALSVIKEPAVLRLATRIKQEEVSEILNFFKSISAMRLAMRKGRVRSGIVIAEKL
jgi:tocopherol O-methyltransferase